MRGKEAETEKEIDAAVDEIVVAARETRKRKKTLSQRLEEKIRHVESLLSAYKHQQKESSQELKNFQMEIGQLRTGYRRKLYHTLYTMSREKERAALSALVLTPSVTQSPNNAPDDI